MIHPILVILHTLLFHTQPKTHLTHNIIQTGVYLFFTKVWVKLIILYLHMYSTVHVFCVHVHVHVHDMYMCRTCTCVVVHVHPENQ